MTPYNPTKWNILAIKLNIPDIIEQIDWKPNTSQNNHGPITIKNTMRIIIITKRLAIIH